MLMCARVCVWCYCECVIFVCLVCVECICVCDLLHAIPNNLAQMLSVCLPEWVCYLQVWEYSLLSLPFFFLAPALFYSYARLQIVCLPWHYSRTWSHYGLIKWPKCSILKLCMTAHTCLTVCFVWFSKSLQSHCSAFPMTTVSHFSCGL